MKSWALSEAKAKFSELVEAALGGEPQVVTRRGREAVVVLSAETYRTTARRKGGSLVEFFARSPHRDVEIAPSRDARTGREVRL